MYIKCGSKNDTLRLMKHFSIYFWKICAYLNRSISMTIQLWGASFITRRSLISFNSFRYYNKMHTLRSKKFSFAFYITFVICWIYFSNLIRISVVWTWFEPSLEKVCSRWHQACVKIYVKSVEAAIQICSLRYGPLKSRQILE